MKYIKDIFNDYNIDNNIASSEVENVTLYKKSNKLQVNIASENQIKLNEIVSFEDYLVERFKLQNARIEIKYKDAKITPSVKKDWAHIISYIAKKEPISKAILNNSHVNVDDEKNSIEIDLSVKGASFLCAKKFDVALGSLISNLYNKEYKIKFIDKDDASYLDEYKKKQKEAEDEAYMDALTRSKEEIEQRKLEKAEEKKKKKAEKKFKLEQNANAQALEKENQIDISLDISLPEVEPVPMVNNNLIYGRNSLLKGEKIDIIDIPMNEATNLNVCVDGEIIKSSFDTRDIKDGKSIIMFDFFDGTCTIAVKMFVKQDQVKELKGRLLDAKGIMIDGNAKYSTYSKEVEIMANTILETEGREKEKPRMDDAEVKRVELHMHTQMSQLDAITPVADLLKRVKSWGWKSVGITDHGVVQAFPDCHHFQEDNPDMKILYGVEGYYVPDKDPCVFFSKGQDLDTTYCVFDLETTGISHITEKITEVGIIKIKGGEIIDTFECFVNPEKPIPEEVVNVTHITDDMVKDAETIDKVMPKILEFMGDSVLVAHNADFDIGFMKYNCEQLGLPFEYTYVDTLRLARAMFPDFSRYRLGFIAEKLNIEVEVAHRALDDVKTLVQVFNIMIENTKEREGKVIDDFDKKFIADFKKLPSYHIVIYAKNYIGLKNLYKLISYSHLDYYYKKPRILKSMLNKYREGLILGSACEQGELFRAIVADRPEEELEEIASYYDYLEIQPIGNNEYMVREGVAEDDEKLRDFNRKVVELGDKLHIPVCATCDVHFMDPQDEIYRRIIQAGQKYQDCDMQAPLYLRTTNEMLEEFSYLGEDKAYEVVVTNTNKIADEIEYIHPISPEKCPPHIKGCEQAIKDIAYEKAHKLYGDPLPEIVQTRLDKELNSIISNGYSVMYIIAQKLVWKSNEDGYIVGSRGSVGSSLVAFMTGITEVNSLQPHYRCPKCKYSDFTDYGVPNGFDLPDKNCPKCGEPLVKDGMDIPFETFLGFNGDKEPDIDLNFSGEYQAKAHKYTEVIFGKGTTFKAGTVGTVADKTAFGYVKNYFEDRGKLYPNAEIARIAVGCTGIKRTTGQHPGGIIVVPKGREIFEFTPVQHPADDPDSDIITTHFDYHSIDSNLLKLDILGHDDPTVIRMLQDLTGIAPTDIPLDDKQTMSIFNSTDALGVTPEQINSKVGTFGIPEYGTPFARGMLLDTLPTTFDELIRISGLSHGTDVWLGNAQSLIQAGTVTLQEAICCRDDIMIYLMKKGLEPGVAFKIMESVRKGKVAKGKEPKWEDYKVVMKEHDVPDWYIASCQKIKYMFPKAHAAAYVTNAFRIAWFKVHIPLAYYCAYFSIRANVFDAEFMINGEKVCDDKMKEINSLGNDATPKDKQMYEDLEMVHEFYERGFEFLPIDLYKSHATKFQIEDGKIRPPLNSIAGLGDVAANSIYAARLEEPFECIEDMQSRSKIGKSVTELLDKFGCLKGMTKSNQLSFFV